MRLHDLRHTCASSAISAGANVKVVQKLLGHKTAVLTLDQYGIYSPTTWTRWPMLSMRPLQLLRTDCLPAKHPSLLW